MFKSQNQNWDQIQSSQHECYILLWFSSFFADFRTSARDREIYFRKKFWFDAPVSVVGISSGSGRGGGGCGGCEKVGCSTDGLGTCGREAGTGGGRIGTGGLQIHKCICLLWNMHHILHIPRDWLQIRHFFVTRSCPGYTIKLNTWIADDSNRTLKLHGHVDSYLIFYFIMKVVRWSQYLMVYFVIFVI